MSQPEITVIVTFYEQSSQGLMKTLRSIVAQEDCSFQVVIADDHSTPDPKELIAAAALECGLSEYTIVRPEKNLQTVRNIAHALDSATGRYIKTIGAGDELYEPTTLRRIVDFCERYNVRGGFGNVVFDDKREFFAPKNRDSYPPAGTVKREDLFFEQMRKADWLPGGAQFFEASFFKELLSTLADDCGVRYCEDFALSLAMITETAYHLDRPVLIYEWGTGVSTTGSMESRKRLYADHAGIYAYLRKAKPFGRVYLVDRGLFALRQFIALHTPVYSFFQNRAAASYNKERHNADQ